MKPISNRLFFTLGGTVIAACFALKIWQGSLTASQFSWGGIGITVLAVVFLVVAIVRMVQEEMRKDGFQRAMARMDAAIAFLHRGRMDFALEIYDRQDALNALDDAKKWLPNLDVQALIPERHQPTSPYHAAHC